MKGKTIFGSPVGVCPRSERGGWSEVVVFSEVFVAGCIVILVPKLLILLGSIWRQINFGELAVFR